MSIRKQRIITSGPRGFAEAHRHYATLNGMVVPGGRPTTTWFEWDTNTSYGNRTAMASGGYWQRSGAG